MVFEPLRITALRSNDIAIRVICEYHLKGKSVETLAAIGTFRRLTLALFEEEYAAVRLGCVPDGDRPSRTVALLLHALDSGRAVGAAIRRTGDGPQMRTMPKSRNEASANQAKRLIR